MSDGPSQEKGLRPFLSHPIADAARQVGISISRFSKIWPKFVQQGTSVPRKASEPIPFPAAP